MKDIRLIQIKYLMMKTTVYEMKNTLDARILNIAKKILVKFQDIKLRTNWNEIWRGKIKTRYKQAREERKKEGREESIHEKKRTEHEWAMRQLDHQIYV